jgi:hypothetical protein
VEPEVASMQWPEVSQVGGTEWLRLVTTGGRAERARARRRSSGAGAGRDRALGSPTQPNPTRLAPYPWATTTVDSAPERLSPLVGAVPVLH